MTQRSFFWNGTTIGDADVYTKYAGYQLGDDDYVAPLTDIVFKMLFSSTGNRGVLRNWLNELEVTGVGSPLQVDTGAALVYGMPYENTAAVNVTVPNPTSNTRRDLIVLRRNWAAQTIRITRIAGIEGGVVPSATQSASPDGSGIYDIPLASLSITTGGTITVTDLREFIVGTTAAVANSVDTAAIQDDGVDFDDRAPTIKNLRFGGSDLLPFVGYFAYAGPPDDETTTLETSSKEASWGSASASVEGWQLTGIGAANTTGFVCAFSVPADHVPGTGIAVKAWIIDDWAGSNGWDFYSCWQRYRADTEVVYSQGSTNSDVDHTATVDYVKTVSLASISDALAGDLILYYVEYYNSAGAEAELLVGLEFEYGAYT